MSLTIRARLTLLYFGVLTGALLIFVLLCDYGFQRSINTRIISADNQHFLKCIKMRVFIIVRYFRQIFAGNI